jgi:hypothetical protein
MAMQISGGKVKVGVGRKGAHVWIHWQFPDAYEAMRFVDLWRNKIVELRYEGPKQIGEMEEGETLSEASRGEEP